MYTIALELNIIYLFYKFIWISHVLEIITEFQVTFNFKIAISIISSFS